MKIISKETDIVLKPVNLEIKIKHPSYLTAIHFTTETSYSLKIGGMLIMTLSFHRRVKGNAANYKAVLKQCRKR